MKKTVQINSFTQNKNKKSNHSDSEQKNLQWVLRHRLCIQDAHSLEQNFKSQKPGSVYNISQSAIQMENDCFHFDGNQALAWKKRNKYHSTDMFDNGESKQTSR